MVFSANLSGQARMVLELALTEQSQNIQNNTTTLAYSLRIYEEVDHGSYHLAENVPYSVTLGGTQVVNKSNGSWDFRRSGANQKILASGTTVVQHNADGTKTLSVAAYFAGDTYAGSASIADSMVLTRINRGRAHIGQDDGTPKAGQVSIDADGVIKQAIGVFVGGDDGTPLRSIS